MINNLTFVMIDWLWYLHNSRIFKVFINDKSEIYIEE